MQLGDGAIVHEHEVGLLDAGTEVLLVGVGGGHLTLLVGHKGLEIDVVGL
ncbi:MAG: hypothetical protein J6X10_03630 [Bacteroidales bacterium]|nr:hypothetical protein [Bacteroidales bacterium]